MPTTHTHDPLFSFAHYTQKPLTRAWPQTRSLTRFALTLARLHSGQDLNSTCPDTYIVSLTVGAMRIFQQVYSNESGLYLFIVNESGLYGNNHVLLVSTH